MASLSVAHCTLKQNLNKILPVTNMLLICYSQHCTL